MLHDKEAAHEPNWSSGAFEITHIPMANQQLYILHLLFKNNTQQTPSQSIS